MKKKQLTKKFDLNKVTVVNLKNESLRTVRGGAAASDLNTICEKTCGLCGN